MQIIEAVKSRIEEHKYSSSSLLLAQALASACKSSYKVSLLDASVKLDSKAREMFWQLVTIAHQPDYSNRAQDNALKWLRDMGFIGQEDY